jgi:hypothetical protein
MLAGVGAALGGLMPWEKRYNPARKGLEVLFAVGGWRLAVGGWRLAVGSWGLGVGGWGLGVAPNP